MEQNQIRNYAEYDYFEVTAKTKYEKLYRESYIKFGWHEEYVAESESEIDAVTISYRRNRKIPNKTVVTRLQRQFETAVKEIVRIEKSSSVFAMIVASILCIIATWIIPVAVFCFFGKLLILGIALSVLACFTVTAAWLCFLLLRKRKTNRNRPLILLQYSEIKELIGQAEKLLR